MVGPSALINFHGALDDRSSSSRRSFPTSGGSSNKTSSSFGGVIFSAVTTERLMGYLRMPHRINNQTASEPVSRKSDNGFGKRINFFDMRPPQNLAVAKSVRDRDQSSFGGIP